MHSGRMSMLVFKPDMAVPKEATSSTDGIRADLIPA
jgi:hypothetical protein